MKKLIKSMELRWSDLFLLIGFIAFALFLCFGQEFMQHTDPTIVNFPLWLSSIVFVVMIGTWGVYLFLEHKRGNVKINYIVYFFIFLALFGAIVTLAQPANWSENVVCRQVNDFNQSLYPGIQINDVINVSGTLSITHKLTFTYELIGIVVLLYIGIFVFPKRFKSVEFIKYLSWAVMTFCAVVILAGYIMDHDCYPNFIKAITGQIDANPADFGVKSFILHRNAYGMCMLMGIIFAFISHSYNKKWWNYALVAFFYINMIFSYSKTSILIGALIIVLYVYFRLIYAFKEHKKRNTGLLIGYSLILVIGVFFVGISYITKGKFLPQIYALIGGSKGGTGTLDMRTFIWDNCYQLLGNGKWLCGRGFGDFNVILQNMNDVNGDHVFPSHNAFLNLLTEGGIVYLLSYLVLLGYSGYVFVRIFKKNPNLVFAMLLGVLSFFMYSFIETIHYLVYVFLLPVFIFDAVEKKEEALASSLAN